MPFDSQPVSELIGVDPITGREWRRLTEVLVYRCHIGGREVVIEIPVGFRYDGASVPSHIKLPDWLLDCLPFWLRWLRWVRMPLWGLFPPFGAYKRASILHDWCYSLDAGTPRVVADALFANAMVEDGVKWRRPIMHSAVRWFGGWAYHSR